MERFRKVLRVLIEFGLQAKPSIFHVGFATLAARRDHLDYYVYSRIYIIIWFLKGVITFSTRPLENQKKAGSSNFLQPVPEAMFPGRVVGVGEG